jgi:hypothetical protein
MTRHADRRPNTLATTIPDALTSRIAALGAIGTAVFIAIAIASSPASAQNAPGDEAAAIRAQIAGLLARGIDAGFPAVDPDTGDRYLSAAAQGDGDGGWTVRFDAIAAGPKTPAIVYDDLAGQICAADGPFRPAMDAGVGLRFVYVDAGGAQVADETFGLWDCDHEPEG